MITRAEIEEMISILKRLDVRGFESNDLLIALVRFLNQKLAEGGKENGLE